MKKFAVFTLIIIVTMIAVGCMPKPKYISEQIPSGAISSDSKVPENPKDSAPANGQASSGTVSSAPKAPDSPKGFTVNKISFTEVKLENASEEIKQFIEKNKANRGYHYFMDKSGEITLIVFSGEKNSGGYDIKIQSIEDNEGRAVVVVKETAPPKDAIVTMALTYPVTIVKFKGTTTNFVISNTEGMAFKPVKPADSSVQPAPNPSCEIKIAIRGTITKLTPSSGSDELSILVEGKLEADTQFDKAVVRVKPDTKVYKGKTIMSVKDLKIGMAIEVEYDGPVMKSYPPQMGADKINVL